MVVDLHPLNPRHTAVVEVQDSVEDSMLLVLLSVMLTLIMMVVSIKLNLPPSFNKAYKTIQLKPYKINKQNSNC